MDLACSRAKYNCRQVYFICRSVFPSSRIAQQIKRKHSRRPLGAFKAENGQIFGPHVAGFLFVFGSCTALAAASESWGVQQWDFKDPFPSPGVLYLQVRSSSNIPQRMPYPLHPHASLSKGNTVNCRARFPLQLPWASGKEARAWVIES